MHRVLEAGRLLDLLLLLLLLLLLELLLGAIIVGWRRHRSGSGHGMGRDGISGVRVHRSGKIRMGQCFCSGDAL